MKTAEEILAEVRRSALLDFLERFIHDAEHAEFLRAIGQPVSQENLDGAWEKATRWKDGRRERARAVAVALIERFEITERVAITGDAVDDTALGQERVDCHSIDVRSQG